MTHDEKDRNLNEAVSALRADEPNDAEVRAAGARLWESMSADAAAEVEQIRGCADVRVMLPAYAAGQLSAARAMIVRDHLGDCVACRNLAHAEAPPETRWTPPVARTTWSARQMAFAAALIAVVALSIFGGTRWYFATPAGARARVQSVDGGLYRVSDAGMARLKPGDEISEGELIRTAAGGHAFVELRDGSVVEMSERAEFSVTARRNNTTLDLDQGRIIVQAAKRRSGHLYVVAPDCRVSVTGTVFAVNSGTKGSRVSVIEGEVRVTHNGSEDVLHAGQQDATSDSMSPVPVADEIAWSQNLDKHLALLAQFAVLQKKFEQIPTPGLRYSSAILGRLPANVTLYASVPNLGEALSEANRIFREQLQQSPVLREWWERGQKNHKGPSFDEMVQKLHDLSQYLGDEVALVVLSGQQAGESRAVIMAEVRRDGVKQMLETQFAALSAQPGSEGLRVIEPQHLMSVAGSKRSLIALVRPDFVLFSPDANALQVMNAQLSAGAGGFTGTDFGRRVAAAYSDGAGMMIAANLQQMMADNRAHAKKRPVAADVGLQYSGFADAQYLIAEHRDLNGTPDNRAEIHFAGARHGIASWLAAPAPIGSLDFVSADAGIAAGFVSKDPAQMLDDILQMASATDAKMAEHLAELNSKLNLNVRDDLAAAFGGDATVALDGPILPKPAWKFIVQVNDASRVQSAVEKLVEAANREAAAHGRPGVQVQNEVVNGRAYYKVRSLDPKALNAEVNYTFAGGYMIAAASRAIVINALAIQESGNSLARSSAFRALLPRDPNADVSAVLYQNLAPLIQPVTSQLSAEQLQALQQIAAGSKPTVICAYGRPNGIEIASSSRLLPFDLNSMSIGALLGAQRSGTSRAPHP
jgi:hypothetical protein